MSTQTFAMWFVECLFMACPVQLAPDETFTHAVNDEVDNHNEIDSEENHCHHDSDERIDAHSDGDSAPNDTENPNHIDSQRYSSIGAQVW